MLKKIFSLFKARNNDTHLKVRILDHKKNPMTPWHDVPYTYNIKTMKVDIHPSGETFYAHHTGWATYVQVMAPQITDIESAKKVDYGSSIQMDDFWIKQI